MQSETGFRRLLAIFGVAILSSTGSGDRLTAAETQKGAEQDLLYVAVPGIRDYLEYGGHGILVFDINKGHQFVKRVPSAGVDGSGHPLNVKGIAGCAKTQRLYVTTTRTLLCFDLVSEKLLWEKSYEGGCDRLAISPDGQFIYLPSLEREHWHVVNALDGSVRKKIVTNSGAHNTIIGPDGKFAYLAGLKSPLLRVADTSKDEVVREIGPFGNVIRPILRNRDRGRQCGDRDWRQGHRSHGRVEEEPRRLRPYGKGGYQCLTPSPTARWRCSRCSTRMVRSPRAMSR